MSSDAIMTLQAMYQQFRIVMVARYCKSYNHKLKEFFEKQGIKWDAIYQHKREVCYSDYSQIYDDFSVKNEDICTTVIIVGALSLSKEDYDCMEHTKLLYSKPYICSHHYFYTYTLKLGKHYHTVQRLLISTLSLY